MRPRASSKSTPTRPRRTALPATPVATAIATSWRRWSMRTSSRRSSARAAAPAATPTRRRCGAGSPPQVAGLPEPFDRVLDAGAIGPRAIAELALGLGGREEHLVLRHAQAVERQHRLATGDARHRLADM